MTTKEIVMMFLSHVIFDKGSVVDQKRRCSLEDQNRSKIRIFLPPLGPPCRNRYGFYRPDSPGTGNQSGSVSSFLFHCGCIRSSHGRTDFQVFSDNIGPVRHQE